MRFATASIILAFATTLSLAAPTPSNNINSFFNIDANNINQGFNLQAFNQNDIANLLSGFDVSGFNNQFQQFNAQFDQQAIQLLLLQLGGNQFGNSNLNGIQDLSQFNILGLLVQLGLVDNQQIQNQLILSQQFQLGSQSCLGF
ncbi:uncharacterized protein RAG0_06556 [Rhynchosporium agropyri]|uniref:Uncharacterized protein n=1 Tax=Rhynchosporium agropyri TaxID=914238 RepID=A0A1E1KHG0_9HELO|nr:uncharacterized protein RAG0_06556 [Rhynchosporium agropyri]